jgi:GTPase SAR1 family protein
MKKSAFDFQIPMTLIGDTGVGKTSLIRRFNEETFAQDTVA